MTNFQLNPNGSYANKLGTEEWHNTQSSPEYLAWLASGNEPLPAPEPPEPVALTPEQKLANAGLAIAELKTLLGIT